MRYLLLLVTSLAFGQQANTVTLRFSGVPTGSCAVTQRAVDVTNDDLYFCPDSTWHKIGGAVAPVTRITTCTADGQKATATNSTPWAAGNARVDMGQNIFVPGDVGKAITLAGGGVGGINLTTTIASYVSASVVNVTVAPSATAFNPTIIWGTDNTTCMSNDLTTLNTTGGTLAFPQGKFFFPNQITIPDDGNVSHPVHKVLRLTGTGGNADHANQPNNPIDGGTIFYTTYSGTYGKILAVGGGRVEIDHLSLQDWTSDQTAFIYTTGSNIVAHEMSIKGTCGLNDNDDGFTISGATNANPVVLAITSNPPSPNIAATGQTVMIYGATGGWTGINGIYTATYVDFQHISIPVNSTGFGAFGTQTPSIVRVGGDAFVFGGTVAASGNSPDDGFQGYGTTVTNSFFNGVGRVGYFRTFANSINVVNNLVGPRSCGNAIYEVDGTNPSSGFGNIIRDNGDQLNNYRHAYVINGSGGGGGNILADGLYDSGNAFISIADYTTSSGNLLDLTTTNQSGSVTYAITGDNSVVDNLIMDGRGTRLVGASTATCVAPEQVGTTWLNTNSGTTHVWNICKRTGGAEDWSQVVTAGNGSPASGVLVANNYPVATSGARLQDGTGNIVLTPIAAPTVSPTPALNAAAGSNTNGVHPIAYFYKTAYGGSYDSSVNDGGASINVTGNKKIDLTGLVASSDARVTNKTVCMGIAGAVIGTDPLYQVHDIAASGTTDQIDISDATLATHAVCSVFNTTGNCTYTSGSLGVCTDEFGNVAVGGPFDGSTTFSLLGGGSFSNSILGVSVGVASNLIWTTTLSANRIAFNNVNLELTGANSGIETRFTNAGVTGTANDKLAILTGAPSTVKTAATTDTTGVVGICVGATGTCGTSGQATILISGLGSCVFDGATTAGDYVQISSTAAGDCHDAGATFPASGQVIGRVLSTNGGGGTYSLFVFDEIQGNGLPSHAASTGNTGANSNILTVTAPSTGGTYDIGGSLTASSLSAGTVSLLCDYTDAGGTARTMTLPLTSLAGTLGTTLASATTAVAPTFRIDVSANSTIKLYTTVSILTGTYRADVTIKPIR